MGILSKITGFLGGGAAKGVSEILQSVDDLHTSAEEKKQLRAKIITTMVTAQRDVIVAEAQAGGIAAKWRPYTMLSFVALILCKFALFPLIAGIVLIFSASAGAAVTAVFAAVVIPAELWLLIQVGLGGYVGGRSVEKIVKTLTTAKELKKLMKLGLKDEGK